MRISHDVFKFASDTIKTSCGRPSWGFGGRNYCTAAARQSIRRRDDAYFVLLRFARPMQRAVDSRPKSGRNAVWVEESNVDDDASDGMYNAIFASLLTHNPSLALADGDIFASTTHTHTY